MKKAVIWIFCFVLTAFQIQAQAVHISGTVRSSRGAALLPGSSVYLENTNTGSSTNGQGKFIIKDVKPGEYVLVVSNLGYHTYRQNIKVGSGENPAIEIDLEESVTDLPGVVVQANTMTGGQDGIQNVPGSAYYISPKEIQKFSYADVNRTLRTVPGVNLQEEDGFGLRPNIGLRGTGVERTSKITVMEDGVLSAPAPYSSPAAYYFPTMGRMNAVEILKGSSQIKYGPFTTGGAINLISTPIPAEFGGRLHLTAGNFGSRIVHANVGNSHRNFGYMVETYQYGSDGFKELDNGGNTGFDKKDFLLKFRVNTSPDAGVYQSLGIKIGHSTETSDETYLGLTEDDFNTNPFRRYAASQMDVMNTGHYQYSVTHVLKPSNFFDMTTTVYRNEFHRNWYKLDGVKDSAGTKTSISNLLEDPGNYNDSYAILTGATSVRQDALYVKANDRSYEAQGIQTVLGFNFSTPELSHAINLGFRYHSDEMDRFQSEDQYSMNNGVMMLTKAGKAGTESNQVAEANAIAAYLQYNLKFKNLTFVPGVRFESIELSQLDYGKTDPGRTGANLKESRNKVDVFIPGAALDYKVNSALSVFAGVHKGFAPPGVKEETRPEESLNYELGVRYSQNGLSGNMTAFYNDYKNLLGSDMAAGGGTGSGDLFNGGKALASGLELLLTYDLLYTKNGSLHLPLTLAYTYTDAHFKSSFVSTYEDWGTVNDGDDLPYLAKNQFSLMASLEHRLFSVNLSAKYMDAMRTTPGQGEMEKGSHTDQSLVLDASASASIHKNIRLFAGVYNLADETYVVATRPAGLRPGMPRMVQLGLKAAF